MSTVRVGYEARKELGHSASQHEVEKPRIFVRLLTLTFIDDAAEVLVEHELDDSLLNFRFSTGV